MEFSAVVRKRRSIRAYAPRDVPDAVVRELCAAACFAPSSLGGPPRFFIGVREPRTKRALAHLENRHCPPEKPMYSADFLAGAPVVLVVCVERARSCDRGVETAVPATAHILPTAADQGPGGVYLSAYKADTPAVAREIREPLGIPEDADPVTIVPLGHPAEVPPEKTVRVLDEVLFHQRFGRKEGNVSGQNRRGVRRGPERRAPVPARRAVPGGPGPGRPLPGAPGAHLAPGGCASVSPPAPPGRGGPRAGRDVADAHPRPEVHRRLRDDRLLRPGRRRAPRLRVGGEPYGRTRPLAVALARLYYPLARHRVTRLDARFPLETKLVKALGLFGRQD